MSEIPVQLPRRRSKKIFFDPLLASQLAPRLRRPPTRPYTFAGAAWKIRISQAGDGRRDQTDEP